MTRLIFKHRFTPGETSMQLHGAVLAVNENLSVMEQNAGRALLMPRISIKHEGKYWHVYGAIWASLLDGVYMLAVGPLAGKYPTRVIEAQQDTPVDISTAPRPNAPLVWSDMARAWSGEWKVSRLNVYAVAGDGEKRGYTRYSGLSGYIGASGYGVAVDMAARDRWPLAALYASTRGNLMTDFITTLETWRGEILFEDILLRAAP